MRELIGKVQNYQLSEEVSKAMVEGIVRGNKSYAEERLEQQQKKVVSSGYAWTRSNHIDDAIFRTLESENLNQEIKPKVARAGYFWDYLQFQFDNGEQALMIVKPGNLPSKLFGHATDKKHLSQQSISRLSTINANNFYGSLVQREQGFTQQLVLQGFAPDDEKKLEEDFKLLGNLKRFYILTYKLDNKTSEVVSVKLLMPDPRDKAVVEIQDLSSYIGNASLELEEQQAIKNDEAVLAQTDQYYYNVANIEDGQSENQN